MTFEIEIGGASKRVTIEPDGHTDAGGGRFRVSLHDAGAAASSDPSRSFQVDARPTDLGLSLLYVATGRSVDAAVTEASPSELIVNLPAVVLPVTIDGRRFRRRTDVEAGAGEQRVTAPMPGRVVRVLVKPGDAVSARQGIVIVEAMKMENELIALRDGIVREVTVTEGASVEAGRLLAVIV